MQSAPESFRTTPPPWPPSPSSSSILTSGAAGGDGAAPRLTSCLGMAAPGAADAEAAAAKSEASKGSSRNRTSIASGISSSSGARGLLFPPLSSSSFGASPSRSRVKFRPPIVGRLSERDGRGEGREGRGVGKYSFCHFLFFLFLFFCNAQIRLSDREQSHLQLLVDGGFPLVSKGPSPSPAAARLRPRPPPRWLAGSLTRSSLCVAGYRAREGEGKWGKMPDGESS